jgi:hypothetical protein
MAMTEEQLRKALIEQARLRDTAENEEEGQILRGLDTKLPRPTPGLLASRSGAFTDLSWFLKGGFLCGQSH